MFGQKTFRTVLAGLLVATACFSGAQFIFANSAEAAPYCSGFSCDGQDPVQMGCSTDAFTAATAYANKEMGNPYVGTVNNGIIVELRYSPRCGTNWTRVLFTGWQANWIAATVEVIRSNPSADVQWSYEGQTATIWGNMVYAPSGVCAMGYASIDGWSYSWPAGTAWAC